MTTEIPRKLSKRLGVAPPPGRREKPGQGAQREGLQPRPARGPASRKTRGPLPHGVHPVTAPRPALPYRGPCGPGRARTPRPAPALLPPRRRSRRRRAGGSRGARGRRVGGKEGGFATIPLGGGSRGSGGGGGGWRRRQRRRRRCPGTPPPIVPNPGQAWPRAPHRSPRPGRCSQRLPCSARLSPARLSYLSRESSRGARERTHRQKVKLRQGWSGCWLVPFPLLPPHRPHPLPSVSRAVP